MEATYPYAIKNQRLASKASHWCSRASPRSSLSPATFPRPGSLTLTSLSPPDLLLVSGFLPPPDIQLNQISTAGLVMEAGEAEVEGTR